MSLATLALQLAELLVGGAPSSNERTIVVCGKSDEADITVWAKAVFGADGIVVALNSLPEFTTKVNQARNRPGKPATRMLVYPPRFTTDPGDGDIRIGGQQEALTSFAIPGIKTLEFAGRVCKLSVLLEIAAAWNLNEIRGWTQRLFVGKSAFPITPPRPATDEQRKAAAASLLSQVRKYSSGNYGLVRFMALPSDRDRLADRLKGANTTVDVPFEWFGGVIADFNLAIGEINVGTPRDEVPNVDIVYRIERAKLGPLLQQMTAAGPGGTVPAEVQAITQSRCGDGSSPVLQRIVITIT